MSLFRRLQLWWSRRARARQLVLSHGVCLRCPTCNDPLQDQGQHWRDGRRDVYLCRCCWTASTWVLGYPRPELVTFEENYGRRNYSQARAAASPPKGVWSE